MKKKIKEQDIKINPNMLPTQDELFVKIKNGITKAGIHVDHKKEKNKKRARKSRQKYKDSNDE